MKMTIPRKHVNTAITNLHGRGFSIFGINEFVDMDVNYDMVDMATIFYEAAEKSGD